MLIRKIRLSRLQIYAGLSTVFSSLFYIVILLKFGNSNHADKLLYLITVVGITCVAPQMIWGAFLPHYINGSADEKINIKNFIFTINIYFAFLVIFSINILYYFFHVKNLYTESVFCYLLAAQAFNEALKKICMAEQKIERTYLADIFNWVSAIIFIYFFSAQINPLSSLLIGNVISVSFMILSVSHIFLKMTKNKGIDKVGLVRESMMLKAGSFAYLFKDTIVASILANSGVGIYSTFSYASKAVTMVFSTMATPQIEKEGNILDIKGKYENGKKFAFSVMHHVAALFILIHASAVLIIFLILKSGIQKNYSFNIDYYGILNFYMLLIPLSMLYVCEQSLNKYSQARRSFFIVNATNIFCFFAYICIWGIQKILNLQWQWLFIEMYIIHSALIAIFLFNEHSKDSGNENK